MERQHSIPVHYLLVVFSSVAFFSMPSSLSVCISNTFPCYSSFPGVWGSLVQYLPRILCSPKERLLQFSCWESCKSKNNNSEVPGSIQLNNSHKAQGFGFYDLFCLDSEGFARGAFPQVVASECSREDLWEEGEILPPSGQQWQQDAALQELYFLP